VESQYPLIPSFFPSERRSAQRGNHTPAHCPSLLLFIIGPLTAWRTPVDIFPEIRIPIIAAIWRNTGLPPAEMAGRTLRWPIGGFVPAFSFRQVTQRARRQSG
jgi:hypothetical protein